MPILILDLLYLIILMHEETLYYYRFIDPERSVLGEYRSTLPREIAYIRRFTLHTLFLNCKPCIWFITFKRFRDYLSISNGLAPVLKGLCLIMDISWFNFFIISKVNCFLWIGAIFRNSSHSKENSSNPLRGFI